MGRSEGFGLKPVWRSYVILNETFVREPDYRLFYRVRLLIASVYTQFT